MMKKILFLFLTSTIFYCTYSQKVPAVVSSVDLKRYQGTWYEIARLPNFFEKKLKCITATYTLREDGKITVLNKGNNISSPSKHSSSEGVAWLPDKNSPAKLKVQFFWPFSGDYWIMYLDPDYKFVLVGEPALKYLWILCREKRLDEMTYDMLIRKAIDNGYDVTSIIRVGHDCN
jgi:apolipoprotein D and lipocalin family protein